MSSGLMLEIPSPRSYPPLVPALPKLVLSNGTPSITYSGWLFPVISVLPRRSTLVEPEGPPAVWLTTSPATLPAIELMTLVSLFFDKVAPLTSSRPYPRAFLSLFMPKAVTTTSSSISLSTSNVTEIGEAEAGISTVEYPRQVTESTAPSLTSRENFPS